MVGDCRQVNLSTEVVSGLACQSFVAGLLRLELPWRGAVGEVEVGHAVEQAVDQVGGVGVVDRSQGAGETEAVFKENLRGLRQSGRLRWLNGWFLAWSGWAGLAWWLAPASSCAGLDV